MFNRFSNVFRVVWKKEITPYLISLGRNLTDNASLKRTCLHNFHLKHGAKMVGFAGWEMPVQYADLSHIESHLHTRRHVSLFDVSHMLQLRVYGKDRVRFMETVVVSDLNSLKDNQGTLTVFTNLEGGIRDDLIVNKTTDGFLYVVCNAGCSDKDWKHMKDAEEKFRARGMDASVELLCNGLLALQGPEAMRVLQPGCGFSLSDLSFMHGRPASVFGVQNCRVTRCGYTGEDGVEISVPPGDVQTVAEALLTSVEAPVRLAGLAARDSLRLEAGLCLYGHDINDTTTPVEAALAWTIGKSRIEARDFPGYATILEQLANKPAWRRVGFVSDGAPVREGADIYDETGDQCIGKVTSGCPSPCLQKNISMGYVQMPFSKVGTKVKFQVRKKMVDGVVSKMPFVPTNYYIKK